MKIFFIITLFFINASQSMALTKVSLVEVLNNVKRPTIEEQKKLYYTFEKVNVELLKKEDDYLLKATVNAYIKLFKVNNSHFHLEPIMPYYLKNKAKFLNLIKTNYDLKISNEFILRLKIMEREFLNGNG